MINYKPKYVTDQNKPHPLDGIILNVPDHLVDRESKKFYLPRLEKKYIQGSKEKGFYYSGLQIHYDDVGIYAIRKELENCILIPGWDYVPLNIDKLPPPEEGYLKLLITWGFKYKYTTFSDDDNHNTRNITPAKHHAYKVLKSLIKVAKSGGFLQIRNPSWESEDMCYDMPVFPGASFSFYVDKTESAFSFYNRHSEEDFTIPRFNFMEKK